MLSWQHQNIKYILPLRVEELGYKDEVDSSNDLPFGKDIWSVICSQGLDLADLNALVRTSRTIHERVKPFLDRVWNQVSNQQIFGKKEWLTLPGVEDVGEDPQFSKEDLDKELKAICPFFNENDEIHPHRFQTINTIKKVWQTQLSILIPKTINGKPVTADLLGKIFSFLRKDGNESFFGFLSGDEGEGFRSFEVTESYWIRFSNDVVPHSRKTKYKQKEKLLGEKGYRPPSPIEAITAIAVLNIGPSKDKKLDWYFSAYGEMATMSVTTEDYMDDKITVGAATETGIDASAPGENYPEVGVAAVVTIPSSLPAQTFKPEIFGKKEWLSFPGIHDVGEEPSLFMDSVENELQDTCPFFNEEDPIKHHRFQNDRIKKVWETQMVILIPETINGKPVSQESLWRIFGFSSELFVPLSIKPTKSHWIRITKDVVPQSRNMKYDQQMELLESKGYRAPTLLEASVAITIMNIVAFKLKSGFFFGADSTGTLNQKVKQKGMRTAVYSYTRTTTDNPDRTIVFGRVTPEGPLAFSQPHKEGSLVVGIAGVADPLQGDIE